MSGRVCAACGHWEALHGGLGFPLQCCSCAGFVAVEETGGIRAYLCRCGHYRDRHPEGSCVEWERIDKSRSFFDPRAFAPCRCSAFATRDGARGGVC